MRVNAFAEAQARRAQQAMPFRDGSRREAWRRIAPLFCFLDDCMIYFDVVLRRLAAQPTSPSPASIMA